MGRLGPSLCEGRGVYLVCLVERNQRNQINQKDQMNQRKQIPATRREMVTGVCPCLVALAEVQSQAMAPSLPQVSISRVGYRERRKLRTSCFSLSLSALKFL